MTKRPIVYVSPVLPWPPDQGSRQFQLQAARALAAVGPVTWITRAIGDQRAAEDRLREEGFALRLDRSYESRSAFARLRRRLRIDAAAAWRREPREVHFVSSVGVRALVAALAREMPDAWFVGSFWSTARALREAPAGRRVLLASDVECDRARQAAAVGHRADARSGSALARVEAEAFALVDDLLCLTAPDERAARELLDRHAAGARTRIGRWPVGLDLPPPCSWPPNGDPGALLVYGHWAADFNRDGLEWFVREIWPALRAAEPTLSLRVVGRGAEQLRREVPGVTWVGYVDELRPELERCRAVVVPLRYAGGFRYRLVESLGFGRPVVCSRVAAVGAEATAGATHLEADTPGEWVDAIAQALEPRTAGAIRERGRAWAVDRYDMASSQERVRQLFAALEASR